MNWSKEKHSKAAVAVKITDVTAFAEDTDYVQALKMTAAKLLDKAASV